MKTSGRNSGSKQAPDCAPPTRIAVIGAGSVGATFAYALLLRGLAPEIVLIDADQRLAEGQALDLQHSTPFVTHTRVWAGDFSDCAGARMVVITAGKRQQPGQTRFDLLKDNLAVIRDVIPKVIAAAPAATILIATNPVDVLTYEAWKMSGCPRGQVMGSGTLLDSARLRHLLSEHLRIDARSIHAYVAGEHGDSSVVRWSLVTIAGMPLDEFCRRNRIRFTAADRKRIEEQTRRAAYEIVMRKGSTYFAVALAMCDVVEAVLRDERRVMAVSAVLHGEYGLRGVAMSVPCIIGAGGIESICAVKGAKAEEEALRRSAAKVSGARRESSAKKR